MTLRERSASVVDRVGDATRPLVESRPRVRAALRRLRGALPRRPPDDPIEQVIFEFGRAYPNAFFVQVGANDGRYRDPLAQEVGRHPWRGILVEPVPYVFEQLRRNYGDNPRVLLENVAIADKDGTRELYHLAQADPETPRMPEWYDKLGTFNRDVILKHRPAIPDFDRRLATLEVRCMTFESLCRRHKVTAVDLVQIDTEGYDFEIIKLIDLNGLRPRLIMYEHLHFDEETRRECSEYVARHGYEQLSDVVNTICLRSADLTGRDRSLRRLWRRLRIKGPLTPPRA